VCGLEKMVNAKFPGNKKFCSHTCHQADNTRAAKERHITLFAEGKLHVSRKIKPFVIERDGYKCSLCSIENWQGKPLTLNLDHIDGNAGNNLPSNFRLLCPNCDSQSPTFGYKNRGKGRKSRGIKYC
jgi:5-methylcytosine-specific restriction endonuclease McrA